MPRIQLPKDDAELRALSDADLDALRCQLTVEADKLRAVRQVVAREMERRAELSKPGAAAHKITGAGGIESAEAVGNG